MTLGWALVTLTFLLVVGGCGLVLLDMQGWAQMLFVMASGTAGGGVVLLIEHHDSGR